MRLYQQTLEPSIMPWEGWQVVSVCIKPKESGYTHCGTRSHGLASKKFEPMVDCYYPPGGIVAGHCCALMEPCIQRDLVPRHLKERFEQSLLTSTHWAHLIINAFPHDDLGEDGFDGAGNVGSGNNLTNEGVEEDKTLKDDAADNQDTIELVWDDGLDSNPSDWRPTARAHCIAIKFLQQAISKSYVEKKRFSALLEGHMTKAVCTQLGDLEQIVRNHGSISTALANALSLGITNAEDMSTLQGRLAGFERQIQEFANEALISKEYLLGLIMQVLDVAQEGAQMLHGSNQAWLLQSYGLQGISIQLRARVPSGGGGHKRRPTQSR
jgi:hypothetical protein